MPLHDSDQGKPVFPTTHWSLVASAGQNFSPHSQQALESLCEQYWFPLYAYARRRVTNVSDARDLTQAFFAELIEKKYLVAATPSRGRFRAFLLTAFKHFLSKQWEAARAKKRGGGRAPISLDFDSADSRFQIEPKDPGRTAEQLYDQQWALTLLNRTMKSLEAELGAAGKAQVFVELKGFIIGDSEGDTYQKAGRRLDMSEAAAKKSASRIRQRYRELLRDEISHTLGDLNDIDDEIRSLFLAFES